VRTNGKRTIEEFEKYLFNLHPEFQQKIAGFSQETKKSYIESAFNFLFTGLINVQERLPFTDSIILLCDCFLLKENTKCFYKMRKLGQALTNIINPNQITYFYDEVHKLEKDVIDVRDSINFLMNRSEKKNFLHSWKVHKMDYPLIFELGRAAQTLPYSTASIERNFSQLLDIKTIKRNRLGIENTEACLLIKQEYRNKNENDIMFDITPDMISAYTKTSRAIQANISQEMAPASRNLKNSIEEHKTAPEVREDQLELRHNYSQDIFQTFRS